MVSIIIPVYNCEKYLSRCVESVMNQTYKNIECILVDDGSTDGKTSELCEKFKNRDSRVVVVHKKNEGHQKSRELGVDISKGRYIVFVDADDYLEEAIIEKCVLNIEEFQADIVCFDYCLNEHGRIGFQISKTEIIDTKEALRNMLALKKLDGNMWCKMYHKDLLSGVAFDTRRNCDFVTTSSILRRAKKILLLPDVGYHYSVIDGSQSRNNTCHPREEEYEVAAYELYAIYKNDCQLAVEAESYWLYTLLYTCIKMEKDRNLSRKSQRFKNLKKKLRSEITRYFKNPYSDDKGKIQYLMCYFNLFRPIYTIYSLTKH